MKKKMILLIVWKYPSYTYYLRTFKKYSLEYNLEGKCFILTPSFFFSAIFTWVHLICVYTYIYCFSFVLIEKWIKNFLSLRSNFY